MMETCSLILSVYWCFIQFSIFEPMLIPVQDFDFAREFDKDKNIINGMLCSFFKLKKCNQAML